MNLFPGRSFAVKLTLLITIVSGLAAAVVCTALVLLEVRRVLHDAVQGVSAQARVTAANSTAALDFDDKDAARATLTGLSAVPEFAVAEIRKADGTLFARYERSGGGQTPALAGYAEARIQGRWLELTHPIVRDQEVIGNLTLLYDFAPARRRLASAIAIAAAITGAVIVLSYVAARRLQRSLLRPVRELARAATAIAETDDYDIRARKYASDELGVLTDVFNSMIERIRDAEILRRDHQSMLEREVAHRTAEVIETQSRLRQSERMASLGTLSAGLGHDIGNLLMPLRAHLSAIRERVAGERESSADASEEHFAAVARATEYLQNLSAGLRLMALDPEHAAPTRERSRLAEWWTVTDPLLRAAVGSGIALEHDIASDLPPVQIARHLLTQAVFNLVQNAAFALRSDDGPPAPGSFVRVWARLADGGDGHRRVQIGVTDNGVGMTEEVMRRCLEPYFTTRTRRISSGLGLALVKGIVESAGGTLEVESHAGAGSTFTLSLPADAPAPQQQATAVVTIREPRKKAIVSHLLTSLNCRVQSGSSGDGPAAAPAQGGLWVTDSFEEIPDQWRGRILLFGDLPSTAAAGADRITVVDPSTPLPALRRVLQQFLPGV